MANVKTTTKVVKAIKYDFVALDAKAADKAIKSIATRGKALKKYSHEVAVGLLMHYVAHGDYSKMLPMADAVKVAFTGNARTAFIEWVVLNSSLGWDKEAETFTHEKGATRTMTEEAKVTPFFDLVRDNKQPFDFDKAVLSLLKRAENAAKEGKVKSESVKALHAFAKAQHIVVEDGE